MGPQVRLPAKIVNSRGIDLRVPALRKAADDLVGVAQSATSYLNPPITQLTSRPPSTHTPWSRRGSWRPGGARHRTNDLDAMGRVCSALPGSMVDGM